MSIYYDEIKPLQFLGRGAAFLPSEGSNSAFLKHNSILYLFDCGHDVFEKLINKGILDGITNINIFITHIHSDHMGSLSTLIYYLAFTKNIIPTIYCPDNNLDKMLSYQGNLKHRDYIFIDLRDFSPYDYTIVNEDFSIMYNQTYHGEHPSFSFTYYFCGNVYFYSGDTALKSVSWINHLIQQEQAKLLYIDCSIGGYEEVHVSVHDLASKINKEYRHLVYCMHIDSLDVIDIAKNYGFNVVELI